MSTSTPRAQYHHGDLRNALLDAGLAAARDLGAEALSLREVARRTGVSHSAAYNHFADKNDLLRELAIRAFGLLAEELRAARDDSEAPLEYIGASYVRFAFEHRAEFTFMFQRSLCMPDGVYDPLEEASKSTQQVLFDEVARLQAEGKLAGGDVAAIALAVWSQVHGLSTIVLETPAFKTISLERAEHLAREGIRALVKGLG